MTDHAYNPSLIRFQNRLLISCRIHDRKDWRTSLLMLELDQDLSIIRNTKIGIPNDLVNHSLEDARLFIHQEKLWMSFTISKVIDRQFRCVMAYGPLEETENGFRLTQYFVPEYGKNDYSGMEKNWVFFEHERDLYCIYECHPRQIILHIKEVKMVGKISNPVPESGCGPVHGGTSPLQHRDQWIRFGHYRLAAHGSCVPWRYYVAALTMEPGPPFRITAISKRPILSANEGVNVNRVKHFKSNVVFPCGCIDAGNEFWLSFGRNDSECCILKIPKDQIEI